MVPHVEGRYTERVYDSASQTFETQDVEATCRICGDKHRMKCDSGRVRERIARFASLHLHEELKKRQR